MGLTSISLLNAGFELVGAYLAWQNAAAVKVEKPAGVSPAMVVFSAVWAVECVPYYLAHDDLVSATFACLRCIGHTVWTARAVRWLV